MGFLPLELVAEILRHALTFPETFAQFMEPRLRYKGIPFQESVPTRNASILLVCSSWYSLGLPYLLEAIVLKTARQKRQLRQLFKTHHQLVLHVRRFAAVVRSVHEADDVSAILAHIGSNIREFGLVFDLDPYYKYPSVEAITPGLCYICPVVAWVSAFAIESGIFEIWASIRLKRLTINLRAISDLQDTRVHRLRVPYLQLFDVWGRDWPALAMVAGNPDVLTIHISPMASTERWMLGRIFEKAPISLTSKIIMV